MIKPVAFGSSMTGDISSFAQSLSEREHSVSYTVDDGFNFADKSFFRIMHQIEPPEVLDVTDKIIANHSFYDLILTWNEKVLRECPKAQFFPEAVCSWIDRRHQGKEKPVYTECDTASKEFAVSFLTSSKDFCPGHKLRVDIYHRIPEVVGQIRVHKHMSPPRIPDKGTIIKPFQFSIAVENAMHNNWFADKIVDCFVAKTVPVYWGCPNLEKYFNMDGVIRFGTYEELEKKLSELTPDTYAKMLPAVEENYKTSLQYVHTWNRIEEKITEGLEKKIRENLEHTEYGSPLPRSLRIVRPICHNP